MAATDAIVLAAGHGSRMGADKALLDLGGRRACDRVVSALVEGGCDRVVVVRRPEQESLEPWPEDLCDVVLVTTVDTDAMLTSLRAGLESLDSTSDRSLLVLPVDHALVDDEVVRAVVDDPADAAQVVLPVCGERVGHPIRLGAEVVHELAADAAEPVESLRDVIRRDRSRVRVVGVDSTWIWRDLDTPADLEAARGALAQGGRDVLAVMRRHRSRRAYSQLEVGSDQVRALVDTARHASTSSFLQGASIVAVRDRERIAKVAALCSDQRHIATAPVFLAVCADLHRAAKACERHGKNLFNEPLETFVQASVDAALVGQNLQLAAEAEGLGACMIGAARNHPVELAELLGLPPHVFVVFGMTLGWPEDDPLPRERLPLDAVLHDETYDVDRTDAALDRADEQLREWARRTNQRLPEGARRLNEERGYTDRLAYLFGGETPPKGREHLAEELRRLGFGQS